MDKSNKHCRFATVFKIEHKQRYEIKFNTKAIKVMKAVKINTANPQNLVNALVALNARFVYDFGTIYMLGTSNVDKVKNFLERNDVNVDGATFSADEFEF